METNEKPAAQQKWYSIKEAAEYLGVGEPTIYRWMREDSITFRKVGDSTRFWKEDLDDVMEVHPSAKDVNKVRLFCPVCHHDEMIEGNVQSTGMNYFRPKKTKFWTWKIPDIVTASRMCSKCGAITWFGDAKKLLEVRVPEKDAAAAEKS